MIDLGLAPLWSGTRALYKHTKKQLKVQMDAEGLSIVRCVQKIQQHEGLLQSIAAKSFVNTNIEPFLVSLLKAKGCALHSHWQRDIVHIVLGLYADEPRLLLDAGARTKLSKLESIHVLHDAWSILIGRYVLQNASHLAKGFEVVIPAGAVEIASEDDLSD